MRATGADEFGSLYPKEIRVLPDDYAATLAELKGRMRSAQLTAQRRVNTALVGLYWELGHTILQRQADASWGGFVVTRLAEDLRAEFPRMKGFSRSNLFSMRAFAQAWPTREEVVQQAVGLLPWGHIVLLLQKLDDAEARSWYAAAAAEHGWSRNVLANQIMNRTRERIGSAPSNFAGQLAPPTPTSRVSWRRTRTCSTSSSSPERSRNASSSRP